MKGKEFKNLTTLEVSAALKGWYIDQNLKAEADGGILDLIIAINKRGDFDKFKAMVELDISKQVDCAKEA